MADNVILRKIYDRFQGDPYIFFTSNGLSMKTVDGQPIMDQGFENSVLFSIILREDWFANPVLPENRRLYASQFLNALRGRITINSINDSRTGLINDLQFLRTAGLVSKIEVDISNPNAYVIEAVIRLFKPDGSILELLATRNGLNVVLQAIDPANAKV